MSHHDEDDEDVKAHDARDWELIQGDDLNLRIDGLLCMASASVKTQRHKLNL